MCDAKIFFYRFPNHPLRAPGNYLYGPKASGTNGSASSIDGIISYTLGFPEVTEAAIKLGMDNVLAWHDLNSLHSFSNDAQSNTH